MNCIYVDIFKIFMYLQYFTQPFVSILTIPPKYLPLASPLKDVLVHTAETTAFLDKEKWIGQSEKSWQTPQFQG